MLRTVDLLSFSGLSSQVLSTQGTPLKAVYRGPVIGIRYQHPLVVGPAATQTVRITWGSPLCFFCCCCDDGRPADKNVCARAQSYCRFQVNFTSVSDATQFIDSIWLVCPCKENTGPPLSLPPPPPPPSPTPTHRCPIPTSASIQGPSTCTLLVRHHTVSMAPQQLSMPPPSVGIAAAAAAIAMEQAHTCHFHNCSNASSQGRPPRGRRGASRAL
jgi:hypothetical protein